MKQKKNHMRVLHRILGRRLFIVLLIIGQLALLTALFLRWQHILWAVRLMEVLSVITSLHLLTRPDKSAFKLSLVFLILLFPLFGGALYWIFHFQTASVGFRKEMKKIEEKTRRHTKELLPHAEENLRSAIEQIPLQSKQLTYLQCTAGFPVCKNQGTRYFGDGAAMLRSLLADMEKAERSIFLEYFIVEEGKMWSSILEVLERKAKQGVTVRVVYDDFGSILTLPAGYPKHLREKGIQCRVFNRFHPFLTSLQNNRDHRKIAAIDGRIAYTGGINLADEYIGERIKHGEWKDSALRVEGEAAYNLTIMFLQVWELIAQKEEDSARLLLPPKEPCEEAGWIQPYTDSPMDDEAVGEQIYLHIIQSAQQYLYITTPYLMVDDNLLSSLCLAAKSGVDVRIITPGIPDKKVVHFTTRTYYRELTRAGIRIYELEKGFMHSKTFVSDDTIATVGTQNLDFRSLYLHYECGAVLYGCDAVKDVREDFLNTLQKCRPITEKDCRYGLFGRFIRDICRLFAPLM